MDGPPRWQSGIATLGLEALGDAVWIECEEEAVREQGTLGRLWKTVQAKVVLVQVAI